MERRRVLRAAALPLAALLGGCLGSWPRPTGPRNPPSPPAGQPRRTPDQPALAVPTFDFEADEDGQLRVFGTVENRGETRRTATVTVTVRIDGETTIRETEVTLGGGEQSEWAVGFEVSYDAFASGGELNVGVA